MSALPTWSDELEFHNDDVRRRTSADVDLGATWRWAGSSDAWRLSWIEQTGELYLCHAQRQNPEIATLKNGKQLSISRFGGGRQI